MILISKSISFYKRALPTPPTAGIQRSRPQAETYVNLWFRPLRLDFGFRNTLGIAFAAQNYVLLYKTYVNLWFRLLRLDFGFRNTLGIVFAA